MITLQPIAIFADGEADGKHLYRVRFLEEHGSPVEHVFTLTSDGGIDGVSYTREFWEATSQDPFVKELCESIIRFHQARQQ